MKKYWKSLEEHQEIKNKGTLDKKAEPEFSIDGLSQEEVKGKASRRDFLKMLGFTIGYASLASSCEMPVRKAIPFLNKPEEVTPGEANYYASTYFDGKDYCSVLVKVREGRPIKIEGNTLSPITQGGTSARVQASVLNLYDTTRLQNPFENANESDWDSIDGKIKKQLQEISSANGKIVLLSSSIISPTTKKLIGEFQDKYPATEWITYDAISASAMLEANEQSFGKAVIPDYKFQNANVIVSFNADFLGTWLSPIEYAKAYARKRNLEDSKEMSKHYQVESYMSLTGSNADNRYKIRPSQEQEVLMALYNELAAATGVQTYELIASPVDVEPIAKDLLKNKGKTLVVCGSNSLKSQLIVNSINHLLGNYGQTIDMNNPLQTIQGMDKRMYDLVDRMNRGEIAGLITYNTNPAYTYPEADKFVQGLQKVSLKISLADIEDETARHMQFICPDNNYLESWNDAEPKPGHYSLGQPTIQKLFNTRQAQESLMKWAGIEGDYYLYMKDHWESDIFPKQDQYSTFEKFWVQSLHDGVFALRQDEAAQPKFNKPDLKPDNQPKGNGIELLLYETVAMGEGRNANNPWLQELPDPISKVTWDNYANVSPKYAEENDLKNEDLISIQKDLILPVLIQPGHDDHTVSIPLGYGRTSGGRVADGIGKNVFGFIRNIAGNMAYSGNNIEIKATGEKYPLALTQSHHTMEGRPIVRETTLKHWQQDPDSGNELHDKVEKQHVSLYNTPSFPNFHWGLAINLNSCIGCGACEIACQAENNVAVIGKEEVRKRRIMHWIRIDRYYSEDSDNPEVFHQPVMCQQCDNAPCENVCPVAATPHSNEGLNMMAYNRCIGTRYCMNNCPYRVRRFNWFEYANNAKFPYNMDNGLGKMVLNPDVTVRSRGVVEKCSFCSQRIQDKKLKAKKEGRMVKDGDIKVACEQACPTEAIVFGNLNDKKSRVSKAFANPRNYHLLEELHTLPSVGYLTKVRNKKSIDAEVKHESGKHE
ncbi:MAG: TAT-variant-translocated molybdopterin oxidoreductase [Bacteroidales bacterium]|nr:TAT-variant-translocated molybdopterin oxidoreductase [Bacteroidales bacterium]MCF8386816.1 TAT-variant-translocated molybdopterin oxidoreductase [Bacteroidales bacterium]MCF8398651.1 TAT-variant-translocated molybdopterin oxidoreductase [Bacteroidales bacterium]